MPINTTTSNSRFDLLIKCLVFADARLMPEGQFV